jgi:hypothetical protein
MNFFKIKTTWTHAELAVFKVCMASAYIMVGTCFHKFFHNYYVPLLIIFGISVVWVMYLWIKKMKARK